VTKKCFTVSDAPKLARKAQLGQYELSDNSAIMRIDQILLTVTAVSDKLEDRNLSCGRHTAFESCLAIDRC